MNHKKSFLILALVLVLLIGGAYVLYDQLADSVEAEQLATKPPVQSTPETTAGADETQAAQQAPAPDFTVYDAQGNAYRLSDFYGKPVVLNFWASWCGPCKMEMPDLETAYQQYGDQVHFLIVNMTDGYQETLESATQFMAQSGYTFPVYYDTDMDAAVKYGVQSLPTTYFLDAQGYGVAYGKGMLSLEAIRRGIGMILPQ